MSADQQQLNFDTPTTPDDQHLIEFDTLSKLELFFIFFSFSALLSFMIMYLCGSIQFSQFNDFNSTTSK